MCPACTGWAHDEAQGREASVSQDCGLNSPRNFAPRFGPVFLLTQKNNGLEQPRLLGERARQKVGVDGPLGGGVSTVTFFQDLDQN